MNQPAKDRLFAVLDATWPAARFLDVGPWTLREGLGGGQRVSAATASTVVDEADIAQAETGMRDLGQTPLFMIRSNDALLDGWLEARGYDIVDPVTMYLAPTQPLAGELPLTAVTPSWPPLAIQREIWADAGIGPDRVAVMERATGPKTSFLGRTGDTPAGTAFIAADGDIAMMHALEVADTARRKGIGRKVMTASANWAIEHGAAWLALAVVSSNDPANNLYRQTGMKPAAQYHYRRAPKAAT